MMFAVALSISEQGIGKAQTGGEHLSGKVRRPLV